ncbi:MAG TPA: hypothetical protein VGJ41_13915 [Nocardioides sp.]|jgi:hypothetical protein
MNHTAHVLEAGADADVLVHARELRRAADTAEAELLATACAWADRHPPESIEGAATYVERGFGDTAIPVAGPARRWWRSSRWPSWPRCSG